MSHARAAASSLALNLNLNLNLNLTRSTSVCRNTQAGHLHQASSSASRRTCGRASYSTTTSSSSSSSGGGSGTALTSSLRAAVVDADNAGVNRRRRPSLSSSSGLHSGSYSRSKRRYATSASAAPAVCASAVKASATLSPDSGSGSGVEVEVEVGRDVRRESTELNQKQKHKQKQKQKLKADVCALLRNVAQPVAVVTSIKAESSSSSSVNTKVRYHNDKEGEEPVDDADIGSGLRGTAAEYHGATLSSFTSIAMDPYPLVAFALRIPSRMASALTAMASPPSPSPSSSVSRKGKQRDEELDHDHDHDQAHMVINLLSAGQAHTAFKFSRPDLHPTPFISNADTGAGGGGGGTRYTLSPDGLPILDGAVGALACRLVGKPIPLYDLGYLERVSGGGDADREGEGAVMPPLSRQRGEVASELFVARVVRVERVFGGDADEDEGVGKDEEATDDEGGERERPLPLVYHRRSYTTCVPKS